MVIAPIVTYSTQKM